MAKPSPSITLYRGFAGSGNYIWSPFVTKLETRLRFAGIKYKTEAGSPMKAPRGKIPYMAVSQPESKDQAPVTPRILADSSFISKTFVEEGLMNDLNGDLSPVEEAQDMAIRALLEDKLYFYQLYERWEQHYYTMRPKVLAALPYPMQIIVGLIAYRKNNATLHGQGTGRFSPDELTVMKKEVWENINALLTASESKSSKGKSGGEFWLLGGTAPTEADTTLYGFIASALVCEAAPETMSIVKSHPTVMDYATRIHKRYFPDYEDWE